MSRRPLYRRPFARRPVYRRPFSGRRTTRSLTALGIAAGIFSVVVFQQSSASAATGRSASPADLGYVTLPAPVRIADTRPGATDPAEYAGRTLSPGASLTVDTPSSVPANVGAVVVQLTAIAHGSGGYLAAYPAGEAAPTTANVNFAAGQIAGDLVTVAVGVDPSSGGAAVSILNGAGSGAVTDFTLDLYGYFAPQTANSGAAYTPLDPARIYDTRPGSTGCASDPCAGAGSTLGPGGTVEVPVTTIGGVPPGATAVVVNIAVVDTTAQSYLEAYPSGSPPSASALTVNQNWLTGQVLSTKAIVGVGAAGDITLMNAKGTTDVVVDVDGYFGAPGGSGDLFHALAAPERLCDTRSGGCSQGPESPGSTMSVVVAGSNGIPSNAVAGVLNVTDLPDGPNYLTVFPSGQPLPVAADINFTNGDPRIVSNPSYATIGANGEIGVYDSTSPANIVVDAFGYFAPAPPTLRITTTSLPDAQQGVSYTAAVDATGGAPPYSWSTVSGSLPPGLTLAAGGELTGTPSSEGSFSFTVQVNDSSTPAPQVASVVLSLSVSAPTPPTLTSGNWSGYVVTGGPFTSVTGTFTVPSLVVGTPLSSAMGEWVGIDGANSNSVIQAGIGESVDPFDPSFFVLQPWWETFPAPSVNITSVTVAPGDEVTVTIAQLGANSWEITLEDATNGQTFTTDQSYDGKLSSAEWIVEAPVDSVIGQTVLAQYSPPVSFTGLNYAGTRQTLSRFVLVQNGETVAIPSALTSSGFEVAYGSSAPPAPQEDHLAASAPGTALRPLAPAPDLPISHTFWHHSSSPR